MEHRGPENYCDAPVVTEPPQERKGAGGKIAVSRRLSAVSCILSCARFGTKTKATDSRSDHQSRSRQLKAESYFRITSTSPARTLAASLGLSRFRAATDVWFDSAML
jgi:hypothetical protein